MNRNNVGTIRQLGVIFQRDTDLFISDPKKIASTLLFPAVIAVVIVVVSKDSIFANYEGTKSALFTILCAGIYVGMFNSLTSIFKERKIIKREYMTNMSLASYVIALVFFQGILVMMQSLIFMLIYWGQIDFPSHGLWFGNAFWDYYVTLFLVMFISDLMGMVISSAVKTNEMANLIAPIVIIIQLVLSGVLFDLDGNVKYAANLTVSKWGMEAFGALSALNDEDLAIQEAFPMIPHDTEAAYEATAAHLVYTWEILLLMGVVLTIACIILLSRVEKDSR